MYKSIPRDIRKYELDQSLHQVHKSGQVLSDFGMDSTKELLDKGFGLYSSADLKSKIGPIKTEYYRIGLIRTGKVDISIGLERFHLVRNCAIFGYPGQIFSLENASQDFFNYYLLFNQEFALESLDLINTIKHAPFFSPEGIQSIEFMEEEAQVIESLLLKMNDEIKFKKAEVSQVIRVLLQLIIIYSNRRYGQNMLIESGKTDHTSHLFTRFLKLVSLHFLQFQKVTDYAAMLFVSPDHLNRTIKLNSDKTCLQWIDQMILLEAKALLKHSVLSISEIAYKLKFSDPSHFNKFFKKQTSQTPLQYRIKAE